MTKLAETKVKCRDDLTKLIDDLDLHVGVEIGVDEGFFSDWLLANSNLQVLHSIDAWSTETEKTLSEYAARNAKIMADRKQEYRSGEQDARERLSKFGGRSHIIKAISWEAAGLFEDNSIDFIYFDGSHTKDGLGRDIICWLSKIKNGGVISGHDYCRKHGYGVIEVVDNFVKSHGLQLHLTRERESPSWWTIK